MGPDQTFSDQVILHVIGAVAAEGVRVCDRLPTRLGLVSLPRGAQLGAGQVCWSIHRLAADARRQLTMRVRAAHATWTASLANTVVMRATNARRETATARVIITGQRPPPTAVGAQAGADPRRTRSSPGSLHAVNSSITFRRRRRQ